MAKASADHKKMFSQKFLEFEKNGLLQYGKYLDSQAKLAEKMRYNAAYKKYIEQQIAGKDKKIARIDAKLAELQ